MPDEPGGTPPSPIRDPLAEIDQLQEVCMQLEERIEKLELASATELARVATAAKVSRR